MGAKTGGGGGRRHRDLGWTEVEGFGRLVILYYLLLTKITILWKIQV